MDGEVDLKFGGRCLKLGRKPVNGNGLEALRGAGRVRLGSDFGAKQLKLGIGVDGGEQGGRLVVFIGMQMQEWPTRFARRHRSRASSSSHGVSRQLNLPVQSRR
jgi:hypothetical protein